MKPEQIQIGKTYRNRGAGRTTRTVVKFGTNTAGVPVVNYTTPGREHNYWLNLPAFARWAGEEVQS